MTPMSEMTVLPPAPRKVTLSVAGIDRLAIPIVLLVIATVLLTNWVTSRHAHMVALCNSGLQAQALVFDKHYTSGKSTTYYLDFNYDYGGNTYSGEDEVGRDEYDAANAASDAGADHFFAKRPSAV